VIGAAVGGVSNAVHQYNETGRVDGNQVLNATAEGAVIGGGVVIAAVAVAAVAPLAAAILSKAINGDPRSEIAAVEQVVEEAAPGLENAASAASTESEASTQTLSSPSPVRVKYGPESYSPNPLRPTTATDRWDDFLGDEATSDVGPNGVQYPDRIFSSDGMRSIRYGNHEMDNSHFHEETWMYDPVDDKFNVPYTTRHVQDR